MAEQTKVSSPAPRRHGFPSNGFAAAALAPSPRTRTASRAPRRPAYHPRIIDDPNYVRIYTTLRDVREQSSGATIATAPNKLLMADQLADLGVDIIEAGFPAFSPQDFDAVRSIAMEIGNKEYTPGGQPHVPVICALSRCILEDIDRAWDAVRHAQRPRINMYIATSEMFMECNLRRTPQEVVAIAKAMVAYARGLGCPDVQFSAEDAGRSHRGFLIHILGEVIKAGATTLSISDTIGHTLPDEFGNLIAGIKANTPGIGNVVISAHCQSYHGLATANALAGARAGARQLEVAIGTNEERAGNASMEEVVRAIEYHKRQLGGPFTVINSQLINRISKMVKEHNGTLIQRPHMGTTGAHTFGQEGGPHQVGSSSPANDSDLSKKGFLSFIHTLVNTLLLFYSSLMVFSYSYPGSQKALVTYDETLIKGIFFSNALLWFGSLVMFSFASHFKDGESIDHVGFDIFMGVLFLWMLFFIATYCTTLHVFLQISISAVCAFGVAAFFVTVLPSILYTEYQRPMIVKWGKSTWRKLRDCCAILRALPGCFKKALKFCANLSGTRLLGVTEDEKSLPSCTVVSEKELGSLKLECFSAP